MHIGILTQPLRNNYGGLLQAWALQKVLTENGHEAIIINREHCRLKDMNLIRRTASIVKRELFIALGKEERRVNLSHANDNYMRQNLIPFIEQRYQGISSTIYTEKALREYIKKEKFDGFVVGSDQVWRPCYSPSIGNYFLDFLPNSSHVKRIAFAASFGVDTWEYNSSDTQKCARLARKFDLITVRESSGIELVKKYFNANAVHVADPTMLLDSSAYDNLIDNPTCKLQPSEGQLFCYVLDSNSELEEIIHKCGSTLRYKAYYCNALRKVNTIDNLNRLNECVFPPVEQWLKSFRDAEMVITDSFHGCIFSIIFNKPFWVTGNIKRGMSRFISILELFHLKDRLINVENFMSRDLTKPIDWDVVNCILEKKRDESISLLLKCLNE